LKITFLGTGTSQGVPVIGCDCPVCTSLDYRDKRLRTSVFLETEGGNLVIDTGPDFRQQMLREDIKKLDAVIFTHGHKDHVAGLDDVRAFNFMQSMDMPVYAQSAVLAQLKIEFSYAFEPLAYPGIPRLNLIEITEKPFSIGGLHIIPLPVLHLKMPVLGYRINNFSYITDANFIPDETFKKLEGTEILVINALQRENHISHFNQEQAIAVARKVAARQTYFTHVSHKLGLHKAVEKELPEAIALGYDGLQMIL